MDWTHQEFSFHWKSYSIHEMVSLPEIVFLPCPWCDIWHISICYGISKCNWTNQMVASIQDKQTLQLPGIKSFPGKYVTRRVLLINLVYYALQFQMWLIEMLMQRMRMPQPDAKERMIEQYFTGTSHELICEALWQASAL